MIDIRNYLFSELEDVLRSWNEPDYHARQIFNWLYNKGVNSFSDMTNLSTPLRQRLKEGFTICGLNLSEIQESKDGTAKFLFKLDDGSLIESVLIPAQNRNTVCISTQVGCKYSCVFCASGLGGFKRNLYAWEIVLQIIEIIRYRRGKKITHIVFMGTGEPFDNYDNVLRAIRIINAKEGLNIGARRITISTSGVIPGIKKLAKEALQVELSVSLHAPEDKIRSQLMPVNKKYPLAELILACKNYAFITKRQVTFEYVLIKGVNSSIDAAHKLARLMSGWNSKVNLLIYNPICEFSFEPPENSEVLLFLKQLKKARVTATIRKSRGKDIQGACGQLRVNNILKLAILFFSFVSVCYAESIKQVCFRDVCVGVEISDTKDKRERGLMFRDSLPLNQGMLFIFDENSFHGFWMKNTKIPLDIIWIDEDRVVVDVKTNALPCKEDCKSMISKKKARYVLEVNSGFVDKNNIRLGDEVAFVEVPKDSP